MNRERNTVRRYDEIAEQYDSDWRGELDDEQKDRLDIFMKLLGVPPKEVLDAGCGTGKHAVYLSSKGFQVTGLDLSKGMLKKFQNKVKRQELNAGLVISEMQKLSLESESFDGVWSSVALVHVDHEEKEKVLEEFNRVLKPKGLLYLRIQNLYGKKHIKRMFQSWVSDLGYDDDGKFYMKPKQWKEIWANPIWDRWKEGYAKLDSRDWYFISKQRMLKQLDNNGFEVKKVNSVLDRRLSIWAVKK